MLTQFIFRKHFSLATRLNQPKDPILNVLPFLIAKAILIAFEEKFIEKIGTLIKCSDANTDKLMKEMVEAEACSTKADEGAEAENIKPKEGEANTLEDKLLSSENMLYMFCLGLFNSNDASMQAVQNMKHANFGGGGGTYSGSRSTVNPQKQSSLRPTATVNHSVVAKMGPNRKKIQFNNKLLNQMSFVLSMVVEQPDESARVSHEASLSNIPGISSKAMKY